jgi:hypothetical protein
MTMNPGSTTLGYDVFIAEPIPDADRPFPFEPQALVPAELPSERGEVSDKVPLRSGHPDGSQRRWRKLAAPLP